MTNLQDLDHMMGGDLSVSLRGDIATVGALTRSQQRVLRRLLTNPGTYLWQPSYGAGLGQYVGGIADTAAIVAVIKAQLLLEPTVLQSPAPVVSVSQPGDGSLTASINYTEQDGSNQVLSFSVSA